MAIVAAETASALATEDAPIVVKVKLRSIGPKATRTVEYYVDGKDAPSDKKLVEVPANGEVEAPDFVSAKLDRGLHRVEVRLIGEPDPMKFDDRRFVTVDVQPAMKVLVISDTKLDSEFVSLALDPSARSEGMPRPYQVDRVLTSGLDRIEARSLRSYAAIYLLNVRSLDDSWWTKLYRYVADGGGLVISPASRADVANYNSGIADNLLPADSLKGVVAHRQVDPPFTFGKADLGHPIFSENSKELMGELSRVPIYRTRSIEPDKNSRVLLRYTDDSPALLERIIDGPRPGKVLLWTTALSRDPRPNDPNAWNDFPVVGWGFLVVMDQTTAYLAGASGGRLQYDAGDDATLSLDPEKQFTGFTIKGPKAAQPERLNEAMTGPFLLVTSPGDLGQWTIFATTKEGAKREYGFSVNPPLGEMSLTPLDPKDLDVLFGKDKYQLADDAASLKFEREKIILGREIFPWLMALILLIVTLENLLANTFYREKVKPKLA